jgi:hypothetical protein
MRKSIVLGLATFLLCGLIGCGGGGYQGAMKKVLGDLNDLARALKQAKTKEAIDAALPRIQEARSKLDADVAKLSALEPRNEKEREAMRKHYGPAIHNLVTEINNRKNASEEIAKAVGTLPSEITSLDTSP